MSDNLMNFDMPQRKATTIKVIGVGGGGGNAVNHMYSQGIQDVDFIVCNTDLQDLQKSPVPIKIQLGDDLTKGRGAGSNPDVGEQAAKESSAQIQNLLADDTQMVFITAGMGGGTGTGAAPIIAEIAKEMGILTVGIVTLPFSFEGMKRYKHAMHGVEALSQNVDAILIINNETLREKYGNLKVSEAFSKADNVLTTAAKGIAEIITKNGEINVDFADVRSVMLDSGVAIMASGIAEGQNRAYDAIEETLDSPLLNKADIRGAKDILLNISSGANEITMDETSIITTYVQQKAEREVNIIFGVVRDESLEDEVAITLIATGFDMDSIPEFKSTVVPQKVDAPQEATPEKKVYVVSLDNDAPQAKQYEITFPPQEPEEPVGNISLINPNSPFDGSTSIVEDTQKNIEKFDYEQIKIDKNFDEIDKKSALERKRISLESANNDLTEPSKSSEPIEEEQPKVSTIIIEKTDKGISLNQENRYLNHNVD